MWLPVHVPRERGELCGSSCLLLCSLSFPSIQVACYSSVLGIVKASCNGEVTSILEIFHSWFLCCFCVFDALFVQPHNEAQWWRTLMLLIVVGLLARRPVGGRSCF